LRELIREAGRQPADVGIEGRISVFNTPEPEWPAALDGWRDLGASHVAINTMNAGLASPQAHIDAIRRFKEAAA
jgi:hypothetical protein